MIKSILLPYNGYDSVVLGGIERAGQIHHLKEKDWHAHQISLVQPSSY